VTSWNQPLVIRNQSPVVTIGGGHVLVPRATRIRKPSPNDFQQLEALTSSEPLRRAGAALYFAATRDWHPEELAPHAGIYSFEDIHQQLIESGELVEIAVSPSRTLRVHRLVLEQICDRIEAALHMGHDREPLRSLLDRARIVSRLQYLADETLLNAMLERMQTEGRVRLTDRGVGLVGRGPRLSANERKLYEQLIGQYRDARFQPPTVQQCRQQATKNRDAVQSLIDLAVAEQQLVQVHSDLFLHAEVEQELRQLLAERMTGEQGLTVSEIREVLDTSRKYAEPICEYLDKVGFTRRQGDMRVLAHEQYGRPAGQ
jgi:selenocysteine-specific elongation factor